jgi:hypothetical protein
MVVDSENKIKFRYDLWTSLDYREDENIHIHCLIPNGLYIDFFVSPQLTLSELKEVNKLLMLMMQRNKKYIILYESCIFVVKL